MPGAGTGEPPARPQQVGICQQSSERLGETANEEWLQEQAGGSAMGAVLSRGPLSSCARARKTVDSRSASEQEKVAHSNVCGGEPWCVWLDNGVFLDSSIRIEMTVTSVLAMGLEVLLRR